MCRYWGGKIVSKQLNKSTLIHQCATVNTMQKQHKTFSSQLTGFSFPFPDFPFPFPCLWALVGGRTGAVGRRWRSHVVDTQECRFLPFAGRLLPLAVRFLEAACAVAGSVLLGGTSSSSRRLTITAVHVLACLPHRTFTVDRTFTVPLPLQPHLSLVCHLCCGRVLVVRLLWRSESSVLIW